MNCKKEEKRIVAFIQKEFKARGFKNAIIGISGGIDSAIVAALLVKALKKQNVYGILLPYSEQKDIDDSEQLIKQLDIYSETYQINNAVDEVSRGMGFENYNIRTGNIKARMRMIYLYDRSFSYKALVIGTGNRTEELLGYFTQYGDGACAINPIVHLYKTEVFELAKYLKLPKAIIEKAPTAGLWEGQTDEEELGATYEEIDNCLKRWKDGCRIKVSEKVADMVIARVERNKFKLEMPGMIKR